METSNLAPRPGQAPPKFTCSICAKCFDNQRSQTRHISYCRKSRTRVRSRKTACIICTKAKTHCDAAYPKCSRCVKRNFKCGYERPAPLPYSGSTGTETLSQSTARVEFPIVTLSSDAVVAAQPSSMQVYFQVDPFDGLQNLTPGITGLVSGESLDSQIWDLEPTGTVSPYAGSAAVPYPSTSQTPFSPSLELGYPNSASIASNAFELTFSQSTSDQCIHPPAESLLYCEPRSSTSFSSFEAVGNLSFDRIMPKAPNAFRPRQVRDHQLSLNRNYVICTLRSYPHMILPGKTLPPFIHPQCLVNVSGNDHVVHKSLPGPLAICAGIVQMYSVKNRDNAVFIWRAIRIEQERLFAECSQYNHRNAVAALQAVSVYFLLRLSEDNDDATNFDVPLIHTMLKIAFQVNGLELKYGSPSGGCTPTWEDWILAESLRRTIVVLFLVGLLFDVTPGMYPYECDGTKLAGMALPCSRDLWRAYTKSDWEREYATQIKSCGGFDNGPYKHLTYGDLLNFRFRTDDILNSWLSQIDDFGTLVMAAASLPDGTNNFPRIEKERSGVMVGGGAESCGVMEVGLARPWNR